MKLHQHSERGAEPAGPFGHAAVDPLQGSPRQVAQRQRIASSFGPAAQLQPEPEPNRTGLPDQLKAGIESLSGMDLSAVRVHRNSDRPAQLNALAYAQGTDIHLAPGQDQHLPHEAWHVVQQAQGRVAPTMQLRDAVPGNDDAALEREADAMGERAGQPVAASPVQRRALVPTPGTPPVVQRVKNKWAQSPAMLAAWPISQEVAVGMQMAEKSVLDHWSKGSDDLKLIARQQAHASGLPTQSVADLSRLETDRGSNPDPVSVHARIGNLEARLRQAASGSSGVKTEADEHHQGSELPMPGQGSMKAAVEDKPLPTSQVSKVQQDWANRLRSAKPGAGGEAYQAGHLVAFQFMGDAANVYANVAPQGAQLNNVGFQNWEHDVLGGTLGALRKQFDPGNESLVPHLLRYTVQVDYAGAYVVPASALVAAGVVPENWRALSGWKGDGEPQVKLVQRIPVRWMATAMPLQELAEKAMQAVVAYGVVDREGQVTQPGQFEASGPREFVERARRSQALAALGFRRSDEQQPQQPVQGEACGFDLVQKILLLAESHREDAEAELSRLPMVADERFATAVLQMTANYKGDAVRRRFAGLVGAMLPQVPVLPWTDRVTGRSFEFDKILELCEVLAATKWKETDPGIAKLRKEAAAIETATRTVDSELKEQVAADQQVVAQQKLLKTALDKRSRLKADERTSMDPEIARLKQEVEMAEERARAPLLPEREARIKKAVAQKNPDIKRGKPEIEHDIESQQSVLPGGVAARYIEDVFMVQQARLALEQSRARRERRARGEQQPETDPRKLDYLEPGPTEGLAVGALKAPLSFVATESQP